MILKKLFWLPVFIRIVIVTLIGIFGWYQWNITVALTLIVITLLVNVFLQISFMFQLLKWLENPEEYRLGNGLGLWTEIFAKLYRLRQKEKKNRLELAEWLSRFRKAMSQLPDGVVILDDFLSLEWCNPVAENHLRLSLYRDQGIRITNLIRSPDFADYIAKGHLKEQLTISLDEKKLEIRLIPFENKRQILVTHDVTEFVRIEKIRRDFIANVSHELRTPLTVINGFLEIAITQPDIDLKVKKQHTTLMFEQGMRMQNLVEDMLVLTRLEGIDYPIKEEDLSMRSLIDQVISDAKVLSSGKHQISLIFDGPDINGSQDELKSAFGNLLSNAIRYSPQGGKVKIVWKNSINGPIFSVEDNGIGIKKENIPRLTERFYRVDRGRSIKIHGTGLGLAIVKHVAIRHNAILKIESQEKKGSKFSIEFSDKSYS